jgi:hypothetical protein
MGEQLQQVCNIGELCTPDIINLPILNLVEIGRPFEIKTSKNPHGATFTLHW